MTLKSRFSLFVRTLAFAKSSTLASSGVKENVFFSATDGNVVENFILNDIILFYLSLGQMLLRPILLTVVTVVHDVITEPCGCLGVTIALILWAVI